MMMKEEKLNIFKNTGIYGITAENLSAGRKNVEVVREMLEAGVRIIQYREKKKSMAEKYEECLVLRTTYQGLQCLVYHQRPP